MLISAVELASPSSLQVVVNAIPGLGPFHIVEPTDVRLSETPSAVNGFQRVDDVVGHFVTRSVPYESVLTSDDVSTAVATGAPRTIHLVVPAGEGTTVKSSATVDLLFQPRDRGQAASSPTVISDVLVVDFTPRPDAGANLAVQVSERQLGMLAPLLGASDVFVVEQR